MDPSQPVHTTTDAALLAGNHRRRRWIVRITLGSLLVLLLLGLGGLALTSSGLSIEEAEAIYKRLESEKATLSMAEKLLGKSLANPNNSSLKAWFITKPSLDSIEIFTVYLEVTSNTFFANKWTLTGWKAWEFRWTILRLRLGI